MKFYVTHYEDNYEKMYPVFAVQNDQFLVYDEQESEFKWLYISLCKLAKRTDTVSICMSDKKYTDMHALLDSLIESCKTKEQESDILRVMRYAIEGLKMSLRGQYE